MTKQTIAVVAAAVALFVVALIGGLALTSDDSSGGNVHTMPGGATMTGQMHTMSDGEQMPGMSHSE